MAEPMFTIVAKNHLSDDDTLDYTASSSAIDQHDEVLLVDDNGLPCAVPLNQQYQSIDARHDFANGDVGESRVRLRHKLSIACDGLTGSARRKLREMMQDRAEVHFTPGFGRRTELDYRPMSHGFD